MKYLCTLPIVYQNFTTHRHLLKIKLLDCIIKRVAVIETTNLN